jgi:hypothetical protein
LLHEVPGQQNSPAQGATESDENFFTKQISADEFSEYRDRLTSIKERLQRELDK